MPGDKRPEAMRLTTTLNLLRKCRACKERYAHLVAALGGVKADHDAPINLLGILRINGIKDCEWVLSEGATVGRVNGLAVIDNKEPVPDIHPVGIYGYFFIIQ